MIIKKPKIKLEMIELNIKPVTEVKIKKSEWDRTERRLSSILFDKRINHELFDKTFQYIIRKENNMEQNKLYIITMDLVASGIIEKIDIVAHSYAEAEDKMRKVFKKEYHGDGPEIKMIEKSRNNLIE